MRASVIGGLGRLRPFEVRAVRLVAVVSLVIAGAALFAGCAERAEPSERTSTTQADSGTADTGDDVGLEDVDVRMRDPLRTEGSNFPAGDFEGGTRVEYTGSAFRMVALQRPVFSPLEDRELARLTSAQVSVELTTVSGLGTAGLACGLDHDGAYLFGVGRGLDGETHVGIAYYDRATGVPKSADGSHGDNAVRYLELPSVGETMTLAAVCRPGDGPDDALLTMTLDGREVLSVTGNKGRPDGQVGLFDWGGQRSDRPLVTDFTNFAVSGSLR